jgi:hypothetical protein
MMRRGGHFQGVDNKDDELSNLAVTEVYARSKYQSGFQLVVLVPAQRLDAS